VDREAPLERRDVLVDRGDEVLEAPAQRIGRRAGQNEVVDGAEQP
jgi:hypothetical protein